MPEIMTRAGRGALLNEPLEAGRAREVQRDEARNYAVRIHFLLDAGAWVARRIAAALQKMHDPHLANIARGDALIAPA